MKGYFRQRYKHYLFIIIGVLIGYVISELVIDEPSYIVGIVCAVSGLVIGETFVYIKWFRQKNNKTNI